MNVFCPNCGTQNVGLRGARSTCTACASIFEVPFDAPKSQGAAPGPAEAPKPGPPPPSFSAPGAQIFAGALRPTRDRPTGTNTYAIISLVAGIVCCVPLVSPIIAIGFGIGALKQLDAAPNAEGGRGLAIAGLLLGGVSALLQLIGFIATTSRHW